MPTKPKKITCLQHLIFVIPMKIVYSKKERDSSLNTNKSDENRKPNEYRK